MINNCPPKFANTLQVEFQCQACCSYQTKTELDERMHFSTQNHHPPTNPTSSMKLPKVSAEK